MGAKPGKKNMQNKIAHYQTPVNNLLLGGHWAELGGGVPIAVKAGANAALLIFKKEKPEAFQLMAGYMAVSYTHLDVYKRQAKKLGKSFNEFSKIFRTEESMTAVERMKNKLPLLKFAMPFIPYISYTGEKGLKKGLNKFFKDEKLHKIFTGETELLSCLVPIGWAYYGDFQSPPVGGGQVLPEWMEHVVKYYGNDIIYKAAVSEVVVENNTAKGCLLYTSRCV